MGDGVGSSDDGRVSHGVGRLHCLHCLPNVLHSLLHFGLLQFSVERGVFVFNSPESSGISTRGMFRKED